MIRKTQKPTLQTQGNKKKTDSLYYQNLINDHFHIIERYSYQAIEKQLKNLIYLNNPVNIDNEALELCNHVLDTLKKDNYRVLRHFKGDSKLSTYLITIIARQAVDLIRKKMGRNREKERAQKFGEIGKVIYEKIIVQGLTVDEFFSELNSIKSTHSHDEILSIIDKIKNKRKLIASLENNPLVKNATTINEKGDYIISDDQNDPQDILIEKQKNQNISKTIKYLLSQLNGEERLIIKMRFPSTDMEKPARIDRIASVLGISEKAAYKRITRILNKCRQHLIKQGVNINDLF